MKLTQRKQIELFRDFDVVVSHFDLLKALKADKANPKTMLQFYKNTEIRSFETAVDIMEWLISDGVFISSACEESYCGLVKRVVDKVIWYLDDKSYEKQSIMVFGEKVTLGELRNAIRLLEFGFTPRINNINDFMSFVQTNAFDYILNLKNYEVNSADYATIIQNFFSNSRFHIKGVKSSFDEKVRNGTAEEIKFLANRRIQGLNITDIKVKFWLVCLESGFNLGDAVLRLDYLLQKQIHVEEIKKLIWDIVWRGCCLNEDEMNNLLTKFSSDKNLLLYLSIVNADEEVVINNIHPENYNAVEFHDLVMQMDGMGYKNLIGNLVKLVPKNELFKFITFCYFEKNITIDMFKDMVNGIPDDFSVTSSAYIGNLMAGLGIMLDKFNYNQDICSVLFDKSNIWINSDNKAMRRLGANVLRTCVKYSPKLFNTLVDAPKQDC